MNQSFRVPQVARAPKVVVEAHPHLAQPKRLKEIKHQRRLNCIL